MKETMLIIAWLASLVLAVAALYRAAIFKIDRDYWKKRYEDWREFADATEKRFYAMSKIAEEENRVKQILCNDLIKRLTPEEYVQLQEVIELERLAKKE